MTGIIGRYVFREAARTWVVVTLVLLLILVTNQFASVIGDAASDRLPRDAISLVMGLTTLQYLTILVPVSLFLAVMLALARLYSDSEMAALMACGVAPQDLYRPLLMLAGLLALVVGWLALTVAPGAIRDVQDLAEQARRQASLDLLEPGRFVSFAGGQSVLYAESVGDKGRLRNVFVQRRGTEGTEVVVAREAWQVIDEAAQIRVLTFGEGTRYEGEPGSAAFRVITFAEHGIPFALPAPGPVVRRPQARSLSELRVSEKLEDRAELQWRLSVPITVLVLTILAVPLARSEPRQGRFAGLAPAVLVYITYANLLGAGKVWIERGTVPVGIGLWWVHGVFLTGALLLLAAHEGWLRPRSLARGSR
ncbi:MAG: LPS export ABC transporter permease LptF [Chromatiales bacterium]|nr:LPS export ABC transporter permease LptF [Chromatiales bacterium]